MRGAGRRHTRIASEGYPDSRLDLVILILVALILAALRLPTLIFAALRLTTVLRLVAVTNARAALAVDLPAVTANTATAGGHPTAWVSATVVTAGLMPAG